jgi:hypothetical protein
MAAEGVMSGIVAGVDYGLLFSSSSTSQASSNILSILYNPAAQTAGQSSFVSTGNPLLDLKLAQQDESADVAKEQLQPQVMQAVSAFTTAVNKSTSISQALGNPEVQQVLLTANGLSSYIGQTALVQKVLMSDPNDPKSLVNQLGNAQLLSTVQTYNFAKNGLSELQNPMIQQTLSSGYAQAMWLQSLDQATPGLSNAITFLGQASSIKSSADILDNITNFYVVTTALGIPQSIINQPLAAQQQALNSRLDYSKLQDPNYVSSLTDQYLLTMQENSTSGTTNSGTASMLNLFA